MVSGQGKIAFFMFSNEIFMISVRDRFEGLGLQGRPLEFIWFLGKQA